MTWVHAILPFVGIFGLFWGTDATRDDNLHLLGWGGCQLPFAEMGYWKNHKLYSGRVMPWTLA